LNRETKRMLQRQGQVRPDGSVAPPRAPNRPQPKPPQLRTRPSQYFNEVRAELRKVAWPTRDEVVNYSIVVLIAVVILTVFVFALDYVFAKGVLFLFKQP
jgi:preprotein translocase subunit SecE